MKNYIKYLTPAQNKPLPGLEMVRNNAGGYVFEISDQEALEHFLLLGSEGGTYYVSEEKLTAENASRTIEYIKKEGTRVVNTILSFCKDNRAPKHNAIIFCYALVLTFGDNESRKLAYSHISDVCYTPTHLFQLLTFLKPLRGWSRGLRKAVASWYLDRPLDKLAYQVVKYRTRSGYTHRDVLRLSHPKTIDDARDNLFRYLVDKPCIGDMLPPIVRAKECLDGTTDTERAVSLILANNLSWEMVPTEKLNSPEVLAALLPSMPLNALLRNLNRFSYNELTNDNNLITKLICAKLTEEKLVQESGIHPITVINTMIVYKQGYGNKGCKTWKVNQHIVDALATTYSLAMKTITPTNKSILLAIDTSGSMTSNIVSNMSMSCSQIGLILAHTMLQTEPNLDIICFDTAVHELPFRKRNSVDEILKHRCSGGGTDCAIPVNYAYHTNIAYDAIITITDCETWAGKIHVKSVFYQYRRHINKQTKFIEIALAANPFTLLPNDKDMLRIVGFDASVITLLQEFLGR